MSLNLYSNNCFPTASPDRDCQPNEISCDGRCLPYYTRCNGSPECTKGEDEENCPDSTENPIVDTNRNEPSTVVFYPL